MTINEIAYLASRFRRGIEIAHEENLFRTQPFSDFPNACCTDAPDLLAQYLMEHDHTHGIKCRYVYGSYDYDEFENRFGHAWLVVNKSIIVDIAADQRQFCDKQIFPQNAFVPCFVDRESEFHSMFEIIPSQCRDFHGLECLGAFSYRRMKPLYATIVKCIGEENIR